MCPKFIAHISCFFTLAMDQIYVKVREGVLQNDQLRKGRRDQGEPQNDQLGKGGRNQGVVRLG